MKTITLVMTLAAMALPGGAAIADDGKDRGRGFGGPPPWAGRSGSQVEYWRWIQDRQNEDAYRSNEWQRELERRAYEQWRGERHRAEEWSRENAYLGPRGWDESRNPGQRSPYDAQGPIPYGGLNPYESRRGYVVARPSFDTYSGSSLVDALIDYGVLGLNAPNYAGSPNYPAIPNYAAPAPYGYGYEAYPTPTGDYPVPYPVPNPVPASVVPGEVPGLANQLAGQAEEFVQFFSTQRGIVPEWERFMNDAVALRDSAVRLRDLSAQGANLGAVRAEFGAVANRWQRLEGRMARVNRGRVGPNIAKALEMGQVVGQIGQYLP